MAKREALQRALTSIDVSDPRLYQQDCWRPLFSKLRRDDPVHYCEASQFGPYWSVTRYDDIFAVEIDHENYSSSSELGGIQITDQAKGRELANFIRMDPPGHTAQRRTVAPIVAPTNLANFEPLIRKRTADVLDALPRNETFDWVERVSVDLTNMMLATLFDFRWADRQRLTWWSDVAIANVDSPDAVVHSEDERFAELARMENIFANCGMRARPRRRRSTGSRCSPIPTRPAICRRAAGPSLRDHGAAGAALFEFHSRFPVVTGANPLLGSCNERSR